MQLESARRHAFLCGGPECCDSALGEAVWQTLKTETARLAAPALRTRTACLRVCKGGPWLLVYPEGVWYGEVTPERCQRIVREHLLQGRIITEWAVRQHPLTPPPPENTPQNGV